MGVQTHFHQADSYQGTLINIILCFSDDDDEDDYESEAHGMDDEMTDAYEQFMQQQQKRGQ